MRALPALIAQTPIQHDNSHLERFASSRAGPIAGFQGFYLYLKRQNAARCRRLSGFE
jgi:hypothetical protein